MLKIAIVGLGNAGFHVVKAIRQSGVPAKIHTGNLQIAHGHTEANSSIFMGDKQLDPYSGFPGYKVMRCNIRKAGEA